MKAAIFSLLLLVSLSAFGNTKDVVQEARVMRIAAELRCLVCQNQSIADSHADLAVDLRMQIREQIEAGRSDEEIRLYMVERYGDFVLYRPPFKTSTILLWLAPALLFLFGAILLRRHLRLRDEAPPEALSAEEHARAAALLDGGRGE